MFEPPFKNVAVLTPTREGVSAVTRRAIQQLEELGASRLDLAGCSDVALARNILLTEALTKAPEDRTVFLLVDDDMSFTPAQAQVVTERALEEDFPVSGIYATSALALAHTRRPDGRWWSGLGFMAVRRTLLAGLAKELGTVEGINGAQLVPFCQCRALGGRWMSEDYWFCDQLGGAVLVPVPIQHMKRMPIGPDLETIDRVMAPDLVAESKAS